MRSALMRASVSACGRPCEMTSAWKPDFTRCDTSAADVTVVTCDADGVIVRANHAAHPAFKPAEGRVTVREVLARTDIRHPDGRPIRPDEAPMLLALRGECTEALETLAVIAYKQPITAPEITEIRGVNTAGVINTLIERQLVKIVGRKQVVGRPFMYATTREFLIRFGLRDLSDLPKIEEMAEALGFEVPAGLTQPLPAQPQLDLEGLTPVADVEPMSPDVEPGEKIH